SMHINEMNSGVYSATKNRGCESLRTPEGRNNAVRPLLDWRREARLAQQYLGPSTVDLDLGDIGNVRRNHDLALLVIAALDLEGVERIDVALRVYDAPGRSRSVRHFEIVGDLQHALTVLDVVAHCPRVGLGPLELGRSVCLHLGGERVDRGQQSQHGENRQYAVDLLHFNSPCESWLRFTVPRSEWRAHPGRGP